MWRLTCLLYTSRLERIRNETIKEEMAVQKTIIDCIEEKQLIWYGHVQRMDQDRVPKKTMRWIPREHIKKERHKKTWIRRSMRRSMESIRRSMSDRGLNDNYNRQNGDWTPDNVVRRFDPLN